MSLAQEQYKRRAYERAFRDMGEDWIPANGFVANRD